MVSTADTNKRKTLVLYQFKDTNVRIFNQYINFNEPKLEGARMPSILSLLPWLLALRHLSVLVVHVLLLGHGLPVTKTEHRLHLVFPSGTALFLSFFALHIH